VVQVPAGEHVVEVFYRPGPWKPILFLLGVMVFALFAIRKFDAVLIGPGSFYTSLMPIFLVES